MKALCEHQNLVKFIDNNVNGVKKEYGKSDSNVSYIVLEYADGGELF
jgi:hypothetical protein